MKSIKNHLSVILPLIALLLNIQFVILLERTVVQYEERLSQDYTILAVSLAELAEADVMALDSRIKSVEPVEPDAILAKLKENMSQGNFALLKVSIPKFYTVRLKRLPGLQEVEEIVSNLKKNSHISKVETFTKSHDRLYTFLLFAKSVSVAFVVLVFLISFLLIVKQMEVWTLQHADRMAIMGLFGAPVWMKSAVLYRMVIVDTFISLMLVLLFFLLLPATSQASIFFESVGFALPGYRFVGDTLFLALIGFTISIASVTLVIIRQKKE